MNLFLAIIDFLISAGVIITAARTYLEINKIWKRKHEKSVAESVSVIASLLGIATGIPFFLKFILVDYGTASAIRVGIGIGGTLILLLIGSGVWVKENAKVSFFKLLSHSLNLERKESADLVKAFLQPKGATQIIKILEKVSAIDNEIAEEEIKLINEFAKEWRITPLKLTPGKVEEVTNLLDLRQSVVEYLEIKPSYDQAAQLVDILELMIKADSNVTEEEEIIFGELTGLINNYINKKEQDFVMYEVLLVPQYDWQLHTIKKLLPNLKPEKYCSGNVFSVGKFYSQNYAEAVCQKYIKHDLFSTWIEINLN